MRLRLIASLALLPAVARAQVVKPTTIPSTPPRDLARPSPGEWPHNGHDYHNQRYSPLRQLTPGNVARLAPRALLQIQMAHPNSGAEATPIVLDGRLYVSSDYDVVTAFDLRTRKQLWRYEPTIDKGKPCCGPVNRGVAVSGGAVFLGTIDARVIALDAATGAVRWEAVNADPDSGYSITMAPVIVNDRVIVGTSGGEFPTRGSVTAYDMATGARLWRWYAIPSPEEGGWWGKWVATAPTGESLGRDIAQERRDSATFAESWRTGGGPVWAQPAFDAESGTLFVVVGNPAPSNDGRNRPGDNLYTGSVVALDVATGKMRWYFQAVPHDVWDYDLATPPVIVPDGNRKLLLVPSKMGWVYVLDASTGRLVRRSEPFVPQRNLFAVPTKEGVVTAPGPAGGANWPPSAYSPSTGLLYVLGMHFVFTLTRAEQEAQKGEIWTGGRLEPVEAESTYGTISAIRPSTGKIAWQRRTGWLWSGALATAGGLLFVGENDGWFRAYDARTGRPLWEFFCGAGVNAPPVSFELDGEQFIAVVAAGSRYSESRGSALIVFGLGGDRAAPMMAAERSIPSSTPDRAETWPPDGATRVGSRLAYSGAQRVAWIGVDADSRAMSFNSAANGGETFVVPLGWTVEVRLHNADAAPHSARVIASRDTIPLTIPGAVFAGAESASAEAGVGSGRSQVFRFSASRAGNYLIACAVPGHAAAGMYVRLVVQADVARPSWRGAR
ncbi:MAG TPA: PQQ-binding-like beta-propeller repeat protein [Gemmatimonadaceae bacterium]|nr:PQQ-binding-like beta-propeller repeat protein [Gemmatimonadaceae bacterium]